MEIVRNLRIFLWIGLSPGHTVLPSIVKRKKKLMLTQKFNLFKFFKCKTRHVEALHISNGKGTGVTEEVKIWIT